MGLHGINEGGRGRERRRESEREREKITKINILKDQMQNTDYIYGQRGNFNREMEMKRKSNRECRTQNTIPYSTKDEFNGHISRTETAKCRIIESEDKQVEIAHIKTQRERRGRGGEGEQKEQDIKQLRRIKSSLTPVDSHKERRGRE